MQNPFWQIIFKYWQLLGESYIPNSNSGIIQSSLWYNPQISPEEIFYPEWAKKGILFVGDVLLPDGELLEHNDIENKFSISINSFYYHRIKFLLKNFIKKNTDNQHFDTTKPFFPHHLGCLKTSSTSQKFYNILHNPKFDKNVPLCISK